MSAKFRRCERLAKHGSDLAAKNLTLGEIQRINTGSIQAAYGMDYLAFYISPPVQRRVNWGRGVFISYCLIAINPPGPTPTIQISSGPAVKASEAPLMMAVSCPGGTSSIGPSGPLLPWPKVYLRLGADEKVTASQDDKVK